MGLRRLRTIVTLLLITGCTSSVVLAQRSVPKEEVFAGYSYYHSGATIQTSVPNFKEGGAGQLIFNVTRWAGIAVDGSYHTNDFGDITSIAAGPQFHWRKSKFAPFGEVLVGYTRISPKALPVQNTMGAFAGGGIDYRVNQRFSVRPAQVDFVTSSYNKLDPLGQLHQFYGYRAQAGVIFNLGGRIKTTPPEALCDADPNSVFAGTPVKIDVTVSGFQANHPPSFTYSTSGGQIVGSGQTVQVDTAGVAAGSYAVSVLVADNGRGDQARIARCRADFEVKELPKHPPVLELTIEPKSVHAGESARLIAKASSPDNRRLSYSCSATAGRIAGEGPVFTLETAGLTAGFVEVKCVVSDDRGLTASASGELTITRIPPPPPPPPVAKEFGVIKFERDKLRPARVDNEAKGELDRYADALAFAPQSRGVVVGLATADEERPKKGSKKEPNMAAQRAVNTKLYLTAEKGIDPRRIQVRSGAGGQQVELWIVGPETSFPARDTLPVDETHVKAVPRKPVRATIHRAAPKKGEGTPAAPAAKQAAPAQPVKPGAPALPAKPGQAPAQPAKASQNLTQGQAAKLGQTQPAKK